MPNKRCWCEDWEPNSKQIGDCITFCHFQSAGPKLNENYTIWKFCPWCSSPLAETKEKQDWEINDIIKSYTQGV